MCGARTRNGGNCRHAPLFGHTRCLRHAGPKAARAYRQRQFEDMQAGKISYAEFARSEAKRAANRLRDQWKKNPWVHGSTIDLGEYETAFQEELLQWNGSRQLAPAILDWLRWRFRRLHIDRAHAKEWAGLLRDELPRRVRNAGAPPDGLAGQPVAAATWTVSDAPVVGKRRKLDSKQRKARVGPCMTGPTTMGDFDAVEFAQIVKDSGPGLTGLLDRCHDEVERDQVLVALVCYVRSPGPGPAQRRWQRIVRLLHAR